MADWIKDRLTTAFSGCFADRGWLLTCLFPGGLRRNNGAKKDSSRSDLILRYVVDRSESNF